MRRTPALKRFGWGCGAQHVLDELLDTGLLVDQVDERDQHASLGAQSRVDRLDRDVGLLRDVVDRRGRIAAFCEQAPCRDEDLTAGLLRHALPPVQTCFRHA